MAIRVTQEVLEALLTANPNARVTQEVIEALVTANPNARVTQIVVEVLIPLTATGTQQSIMLAIT